MTVYLLYLEDEDHGLDITPTQLIAVCIDFDVAVQRAEEAGLPAGSVWSLDRDGNAYYDRFSIYHEEVDCGVAPPLKPVYEEPTLSEEELSFLRAKTEAILARPLSDQEKGLL